MDQINKILSEEANSTILMEFFHSCVNEICGYPGPSYQQFQNLGLNENQFKQTYKLFHNLFTNPSVLYLDEMKMPEEFVNLTKNIQDKLLDCLKIRRNDLTDALLIECSQRTIPTMIDFDWRVKEVMGSSKVSSLREPLLQLDFIVKEKNSTNVIDVEMNKQELDNFIKILESVN